MPGSIDGLLCRFEFDDQRFALRAKHIIPWR